ncbi:ABC transporter permease [Brachybacterium phenoliresistens]|uniref:ABC transporter permease n=1 Tax=Brachybacterium phenoliresistens TaxID=396014 RepID=Z9JXA3_9MICO|nr:carbohydrate ABC transporter permease [Brachybacterium phenoliresistens]EWS82417.1 ABC transporter permease [Brachybacterium phenoliresistens]
MPRARSRALVHGQAAPGPIENAIKILVLGVLCLVVIVPFLTVVSTSLAPREQISAAGGLVLLPRGIDLSAYRALFSGGVVSRALGVSIGVTVVGTALSLFVSCLLAYATSRPYFVLARPVLLVVLIGMLFSPGIIPVYLVVKQTGLLDSLWALIIPTMVSGFNVIVLRSFFQGIPAELTESATIDGAGEWGVFARIVLPLSKAPLAVVGLFYAVGYWNSFFTALLYISDAAKWPMQLVLRTYVVNDAAMGQAELATENLPPQSSLQMAILVVSMVPILLIYPFLQRHFAKGVLTGAVKG